MSTFDPSRSEEQVAPGEGWTPDDSGQHPEAAFITTQIQCATCGGDLLGLSTLGMCPSCETAVRATLIAIENRRKKPKFAHCARCGYDLTGLDDDGACPECGASIEISRSGALLRHASPEYLKALHWGAFLAPTSILVMLLGGIGAFGMSIASAMLQSSVGMVLGLLLFLLIPAGAIGWMVGWWKLSTRDPIFDELEETSSARKWSRLYLIGYLALLGGAFSVGWLPGLLGGGLHGGSGAWLALMIMLAYLGSMVMLVLQYIYSMLYIRWLALRIPRRNMAQWAKTLTWLGPLVYIVGSIAIIGPLIALGFYWSVLDNMRQEIKAIRRQVAAEDGFR
jgi:hypothetical protein